jgi:hypothetical protein
MDAPVRIGCAVNAALLTFATEPICPISVLQQSCRQGAGVVSAAKKPEKVKKKSAGAQKRAGRRGFG